MSLLRSGGSQSLVPRRKRKERVDRKEAAYARVVQVLGEERVQAIREEWNSWETGVGGREWQQAEGRIYQLLQEGFSEREIRALLPVGGSRIARIRKALKEGVDTLHTRRERVKPAHALSDADIAAFTRHCETWVLEDGFPCPHRRPRQYFTEPKLTWSIVHARYEDELSRADPDARIISYSRFIQYVRHFYPGVRLTRTTEDVCDCCVNLDVQLQQENLSDAEKDALLLKKQMHLDEAIAQRRFFSAFVKNYSALHAPEQILPHSIIPDTVDESDNGSFEVNGGQGDNVEDGGVVVEVTAVKGRARPTCRVLIQAEDYGGGIAMPHYGHIRPSADYFNSNLIVQNYVVADISNNINHVYLYDERAQGKNADALCSLRLNYHLGKLKNDADSNLPPAEISFSLLDNCVRQNKSKAVLMFFAFLSVVFLYKKVVLCFLLPGHSHNIADRVIAWCRRATRGLNLYTPMDLAKEMNKIKGVNSLFIDHKESKRPFFVGWEALLRNFFLPLFEIDCGICTARKNVGTSDADAISFSMVSTAGVDVIRKSILSELFGSHVSSIDEASIGSVQLPRHPVKELSAKKQKSLAAKYFSIPPQHLGYYPDVPDAITPEGKGSDSQGGAKGKKPRRAGPGRPRKAGQVSSHQPSILQFFSPPPTLK